MADAISIQELIDARTDAKTLEQAVNGDAVTTVLSRLGETYPTLSNALNQIDGQISDANDMLVESVTTLFENGGLPATPFATKALMTASTLVDGDYAMVTDDTVNNGLYVKTAGAWVKSKYNPLEQSLGAIKAVEASESSKSTQAHLRASKVALGGLNKELSPLSLLGDKLLNYYDHQSVLLDSNGDIASNNIRKIVASGKCPNIVTNADSTDYRNASIQYPVLTVDTAKPHLELEYDAELLESLKKSDSISYWAIGNIEAQSGSVNILLTTGKERLVLYRRPTGIRAPVVELQKMVGSEWATGYLWDIPLELITDSSKKLRVALDKYSILRYISIELHLSNATGEARLAVNNIEIPKSEGLKPFELEGEYLKASLLNRGMIASAIYKNSSFGMGERLYDYVSRPMYFNDIALRLDSPNEPYAARDRFFENYNPLPTTLAGAYNIKGADYLEQDFVEGSVVSDMPKFNIPDAPNVAPFNEPHDPLVFDASVTRLSALPHPSDPTDTSKVLLMANALFFRPNASAGLRYMVAYESSDGGKNFTRIANPNPPFTLPAETTSTINNMVMYDHYARYTYIGDDFPDRYTPEGMTDSFKYLCISEATSKVYGCIDVLDFRTYKEIPINKQSFPVYRNGVLDESVLSLGVMPATEGNESMITNEEKIIGYDKNSNRFYRVLKVTKPATDYKIPSLSRGVEARSLVISWSEVGDITRWNEYKPFVPARAGYYQSYDLDIIKVREDYWVVLVFTYCQYNGVTGMENEPYFDQHKRMRVDMYVSRDQLKTQPVLMREAWLDNNDGKKWAEGTLWAFGHPFDKTKIYINGAEGIHGGIIEGQSQLDYRWKVALSSFPFSVDHKPDKTVVSGTIRSRFMDGSQVDKLRLISSEGYVAVRVLNSQGVVVNGMDYSDFILDNKSQLVRWNGVKSLPHGIVQLEIRAENAQFSGLYPMQETYRKH